MARLASFGKHCSALVLERLVSFVVLVLSQRLYQAPQMRTFQNNYPNTAARLSVVGVEVSQDGLMSLTPRLIYNISDI